MRGIVCEILIVAIVLIVVFLPAVLMAVRWSYLVGL
jgi:hypothetical protein